MASFQRFSSVICTEPWQLPENRGSGDKGALHSRGLVLSATISLPSPTRELSVKFIRQPAFASLFKDLPPHPVHWSADDCDGKEARMKGAKDGQVAASEATSYHVSRHVHRESAVDPIPFSYKSSSVVPSICFKKFVILILLVFFLLNVLK